MYEEYRIHNIQYILPNTYFNKPNTQYVIQNRKYRKKSCYLFVSELSDFCVYFFPHRCLKNPKSPKLIVFFLFFSHTLYVHGLLKVTYWIKASNTVQSSFNVCNKITGRKVQSKQWFGQWVSCTGKLNILWQIILNNKFSSIK